MFIYMDQYNSEINEILVFNEYIDVIICSIFIVLFYFFNCCKLIGYWGVILLYEFGLKIDDFNFIIDKWFYLLYIV